MTSAQTPWLTLVGIGEDGLLAPGGKDALGQAEIVFGGVRHLDLAGDIQAEKRTWPSPFASVFGELKSLAGKRVAVLATGDPMWFGIGSSLLKHFGAGEMSVLPSLSAFQLAAARMGWPLQETECLSVHGRSVDLLRASLYPGARILALTSNAKAPQEIADLLADEGFGRSNMTVLEHLGGQKERRVEGTAESWSADVADFHTLALKVIADPGMRFRARTPGLPDDAFRHDGKMTKQDIRAVTLAELRPSPGALLGAYQSLGGSLKKISVHRASAVGGLTGWRPLMPVTQWSLTKP
jgi:precorrin-6Y C5,15-methyltransferase (decarboxylating)